MIFCVKSRNWSSKEDDWKTERCHKRTIYLCRQTKCHFEELYITLSFANEHSVSKVGEFVLHKGNFSQMSFLTAPDSYGCQEASKPGALRHSDTPMVKFLCLPRDRDRDQNLLLVIHPPKIFSKFRPQVFELFCRQTDRKSKWKHNYCQPCWGNKQVGYHKQIARQQMSQ